MFLTIHFLEWKWILIWFFVNCSQHVFKSSHSQHRNLLTFLFFLPLFISLLFCSLTLCVFWRAQHGMGPHLSPSILLLNQHLPLLSLLFYILSLFGYLFFFSLRFLSLSSHFLHPVLYCLSVCYHSLSLWLFSSFFFLFTLHQIPGQLHGWCQGRLHERKSSQWHAHHHPA